MVQKQEMFSKDVVSSDDRTFSPQSLLVYFNNFYQQLHKNTKLHALPLIHSSIWLGFHVLSKIKCPARMSTVKCAYTGTIGALTNTHTSQKYQTQKVI